MRTDGIADVHWSPHALTDGERRRQREWHVRSRGLGEGPEDARGWKEVSTGGTVAHVNGIDMYFERRGEGEPLLLLHGGGGAGVNWHLVFDSPPPGY